MSVAAETVKASRRPRVAAPAIPREHGAWVILYAPMVIGCAVAGRFEPIAALLLLLAITAAYLARFAADLVLRGRGSAGTRFWLAVFVTALAATSISLLAGYRRTGLIPLGAAVGAVYLFHTAMTARRTRKRFDRTAAGELLAVAALVSTGPAALVTLRGAWDASAGYLWLLCALFFSSGVVHVNMYLEAVKVRGSFTPQDRSCVTRHSLLYHIAFCIAFPIACLLAFGPTIAAAFAVAGALPALWRAFRGAATVTNVLPPLKRVGLQEAAYSLWFSACLVAAFLLH